MKLTTPLSPAVPRVLPEGASRPLLRVQPTTEIRALDNCGSSDDYFTIPVSVSGAYYAISINENNSISFIGKSGTFTNSGMNKLPAKAPTITNVKIYQSDGSLIFEQGYEYVLSADIPNLNLKPGEYTAFVTDGDYIQEIPFCI